VVQRRLHYRLRLPARHASGFDAVMLQDRRHVAAPALPHGCDEENALRCGLVGHADNCAVLDRYMSG
jgi:hypothetical protein